MGPVAGEISTAFVRIRPNTAGFKGETEQGVKKALISVGKITAGFFAVRGITEEVKKIATVAAEHEAGFAVLGNTVKNARAATTLYGKDLETLLTQEARLKGFNENELATSFGRLIASTHDTAKSYTILTAAEDVARARHISLASAARALDRAQQGSTGQLARLGVVVPKVTTEQEKLVRQHDRLAAAGVEFTGQTKAVYDAQLRQAKAADIQASRLEVLAVVQERFGGSAKTFAQTAEGSFDRFGVSVHQLEVELGNALLPTLGEAADGLAGWVDELRQSDDAQAVAASTVGLIRDVFNDVRATVITLAPALRPVVSLFADLARFSGVGGIVLAITAFKAARVAIDLTTAARAKFIATAAADRASSEQSAAAHQAEAAAVAENSGNLTTHLAAADADARATARATTSTLEFTAALRANSATLAANAAGQKARGASLGATAAAPVVAGGVTATAASDSGLIVAEASSASQAAEAVRELGAAASDTGTSVFGLADSVGQLSADIDHTTNVTKKASTTAKTLKAANIEAAAASKGLAASEADVAAASSAVSAAEGEAAAATEALAAAEAQAARAATLNAAAQARLGASQVASLTGLTGTTTGAIGAAKGLERATGVAARFAGVGARVGTGLKTLGNGLLGLVGGWPVIAAAALAATAFGIYKIVTAETALERENERLRTSFDSIASGLNRQAAATKAYGDAVSSLRSERIAVAEAKIGVERAKTALATSAAGRATLEHRQLIADLASAQDQLRLAEKNVNQTEADITAARVHRADATKNLDKARIDGLNDTLAVLRQIGAEEALTTRVGAEAAIKSASRGLTFAAPSDEGIRAGEKTAAARKKLADDLREQAKKQADEGHTFVARQLRDLANFVGALQRAPSRKVFEIFFKAPKTSAAQAISAELGRVGHDLAEAQAQGSKGIAALVANLDRERAAVAASDRPLARRLRIVEELARVAGKRLRPQVVDFILRSNIEVGVKRMIAELDRARVSSRTFGDELRAEASSLSQSNPALARKLVILAQFSALLGRLPKKHETEVVLKAPTVAGAATGLETLLAGMDAEAKKHGASSSKAFAESFIENLVKNPFLRAGLANSLDSAVEESARASAAAVKVAETAARAQLTTARDAVKTAKEGVDSAREALQGSRESLADAQRSLADGIRAGQEAVADAVRSAGTSLTSIGSSLSDIIGRFLDEQNNRLSAKEGGQRQVAATGPLAARLKHLRELIHEGKGTPELIRQAEQVEHDLQALADKQEKGGGDDKLEKRKERVKRRLDDLTDEFNTGKISLAKFNREVLKLLRAEGINYKSAGKLLGVAFADGFAQAIRDIKAQAAAIAKFGRLPGVGRADIVRPSEVAKDVQAQISRDQLSVERQQRDVLKDVRTLHAKEATLQKANAKADGIAVRLGNLRADAAGTRSNTGATARHTAAEAAHLLDLVRLARAAAAQDRRERRENRSKPLPAPANLAQGAFGFAVGGIVPGTRAPRDSVVAALSPGEAVLTDDGQGLVDKVGGPGAMNFVLANQRPHFAAGGRVETASTPVSGQSRHPSYPPQVVTVKGFHDGGRASSRLAEVARREPAADLPRLAAGGRASAAAPAFQPSPSSVVTVKFQDGGRVPSDVAAHLNTTLERFVAERYFHTTGGILGAHDYHHSKNPPIPRRPGVLAWAREVFADHHIGATDGDQDHYRRRDSRGNVHEGEWWAGRLARWWKEKGLPEQAKLNPRRLGGLLPAFGDGGVVDRPTVGLIGERGPEAIVPLRRGGRTRVPGYASGGVVEPGLLAFVSDAERRGAVVRGQTSLTILVNADDRPARRVLDDLRRSAFPAAKDAPRTALPTTRDELRRLATRSAFPRDDDPRVGLPRAPADRAAAPRETEPGRAAIPRERERVAFPLVPRLDTSEIARTQRDAILREERTQTRILQRIAREETAQTGLLRDVEADVRPRRHPSDRGKNLRHATERANAAARHNLIG